VTPTDLKTWNQRSGYSLIPGRELKIYTPKMTASPAFKKLESIQTLKISSVSSRKSNTVILSKKPSKRIVQSKKKAMPHIKYLPTKSVLRDSEYLYYLIGQEETLHEIAEKFNGVSMHDILVLNNVNDPYELKAGKKIKVKRK